MITIFATPKPFEGQTAVDQKNAIISWKLMMPDAQIILIGDDFGTQECAKAMDICHAGGVKVNELGTPRLDSIFRIAQEKARYDILMYINADIVFTHPAGVQIDLLINHYKRGNDILAVGRRLDTDIKFELTLDDTNLNSFYSNISSALSLAKLHGRSGLDYFIFNKNSFEMPPFLIGRPCWDNWLLWHCYKKKFSLIDCSNSLKILHQNHDYGHSPSGGVGRVLGEEWDYNVRIAGGYRNQENLYCVTHRLTDFGVVSMSLLRRWCYFIFACSPLKTFLSTIRHLRYKKDNV